jgi:N-acetylmuramoyl-L-alanine amidase
MQIKPFKYFVIHCTATHEDVPVSPEQIIRWHTSPAPIGRGWKKVGYSDMILMDGRRHRFVEHNGDLWIQDSEITNGVKGINSVSRHVVYVGGLDSDGKPKNTMNVAQTKTLTEIIKMVLDYAPNVLIGGHNQFDNKACPSFWVPDFLKSIGVPERNIYKNDPFGYGNKLF